jgi:hypothetical protein
MNGTHCELLPINTKNCIAVQSQQMPAKVKLHNMFVIGSNSEPRKRAGTQD